jgi:hypothetical protein
MLTCIADSDQGAQNLARGMGQDKDSEAKVSGVYLYVIFLSTLFNHHDVACAPGHMTHVHAYFYICGGRGDLRGS